MQVFDTNNTGPLYHLSSSSLDRVHWHRREKLRAFIYPLDLYFRTNRWNTIDIAIVVLSILSFSLRYGLPPRSFQIDRVCFAFTIIICYFRLLRFWFVLPTIGPRIIAIEMMVIKSSFQQFQSLIIKGVREWVLPFPFPPIPMISIPFRFPFLQKMYSHSHSCVRAGGHFEHML